MVAPLNSTFPASRTKSSPSSIAHAQSLDELLLGDSLKTEIARRLTEAERLRLAREANEIRERCKTLVGFIREAWQVLEPTADYVHGWHIDAKADHLTAISLGQLTRLQINEPPGCMKSLVVSVF